MPDYSQLNTDNILLASLMFGPRHRSYPFLYCHYAYLIHTHTSSQLLEKQINALCVAASLEDTEENNPSFPSFLHPDESSSLLLFDCDFLSRASIDNCRGSCASMPFPDLLRASYRDYFNINCCTTVIESFITALEASSN